jgi:hypothetical protein
LFWGEGKLSTKAQKHESTKVRKYEITKIVEELAVAAHEVVTTGAEARLKKLAGRETRLGMRLGLEHDW